MKTTPPMLTPDQTDDNDLGLPRDYSTVEQCRDLD